MLLPFLSDLDLIIGTEDEGLIASGTESLHTALEKIREGTYGKCEHCPKKVPLARLRALPYATTCIECQRLSEEGRLDSSGDADWNRVLDAGGDNEVTLSDVEIDVS